MTLLHETTAKNFVLQLGALVALYTSMIALITLMFGVINVALPDDAAYAWEYRSAQESMRFGIAALLVFFPTYLMLTRITNKTRRQSDGEYLGLTKWLIYLSLLVGAGILLGDLVAVIMTYLNGEITTRFTLKALTILVVVGTSFVYYLLDARGYWIREEQKSILFGLVAACIVLAALVLGFKHADTPAEVREQRLDQNQVTDLQAIQYAIEEHYRTTEELPADIESLYPGDTQPLAPTDREAYEYTVTETDAYQLCATFSRASRDDAPRHIITPEKNHTWNHDAGRWCFERTTPVLK